MIDYNSCTMSNVIAHSVLLHPSLLAERLEQVADIHAQAALTMVCDVDARKIAAKMHRIASSLAEQVREHRLDIGPADLEARVIAFSAAARLQCLSGLLTSSIAERDDAGRHKVG